MWKMGKLHLYRLLRTLTKWAKYFWSPHCCEEWIKCNFVTLSWTHSLSELTALFYMRNDDVTIWTTYITHSGQCWIPIAIFRYGLTLLVYLPPVVIFPLFWHFERDTLNKWYFLQMFVWFWYFSVTFEHKNRKTNHTFWGHFSVYVSDLGRQRTFCMLT